MNSEIRNSTLEKQNFFNFNKTMDNQLIQNLQESNSACNNLLKSYRHTISEYELIIEIFLYIFIVLLIILIATVKFESLKNLFDKLCSKFQKNAPLINTPNNTIDDNHHLNYTTLANVPIRSSSINRDNFDTATKQNNNKNSNNCHNQANNENYIPLTDIVINTSNSKDNVLYFL